MRRSRRAWRSEGSLRDKQYELYTTRGSGATSRTWVTLVITLSSKLQLLEKKTDYPVQYKQWNPTAKCQSICFSLNKSSNEFLTNLIQWISSSLFQFKYSTSAPCQTKHWTWGNTTFNTKCKCKWFPQYKGIIKWLPVINYRALPPIINECKPASLLFEYAYEDFNLDPNLTSVKEKMCILNF